MFLYSLLQLTFETDEVNSPACECYDNFYTRGYFHLVYYYNGYPKKTFCIKRKNINRLQKKKKMTPMSNSIALFLKLFY